ncbi:Uncharacterized protein TCAP_06224 [Tolypocladium capitatum]|uniref:Tse2 ADP-ribosyltransferase toxin domain-containing protein n=1 Tax=Tolypocladium capitatum TaxID=45235 RepID=A0A2K3Q8P2_9HYPO|nr:Uncharacterized protein TCAP_06224 [Tolypocladium capitatum]
MSSRMLGCFKHCPTTLFRLNNGAKIKLRDLAVKGRGSYDVQSQNGFIQPKALDPLTYSGEKPAHKSGPNGASMRPVGDKQIDLVKTFKGDDLLVYGVPEGTELPETLILVHEYDDHYSLQPAVQMSVKDLNRELTQFYATCAAQYTREQWLFCFRDGWQYDDEASDYYRYRQDGIVEWYSETQASSSSSQHHGKGKGKSG